MERLSPTPVIGEGESGTPRLCQDQVSGPVSKGGMGCLDAVMTAWGSLLEMTVVRPRIMGLFNCLWPGLRGWLEGDLVLIFPHTRRVVIVVMTVSSPLSLLMALWTRLE